MEHPGKKLAKEIQRYGLTRQEFAHHISVNNSRLSMLLNGRIDISLDWSVRISLALGGGPLDWINKQLEFDLHKEPQIDKKIIKRLRLSRGKK